MDLILQPVGSNMCGQACIAMIAGISIEEAVKAVGHRHSTKTREIVRERKEM